MRKGLVVFVVIVYTGIGSTDLLTYVESLRNQWSSLEVVQNKGCIVNVCNNGVHIIGPVKFKEVLKVIRLSPSSGCRAINCKGDGSMIWILNSVNVRITNHAHQGLRNEKVVNYGKVVMRGQIESIDSLDSKWVMPQKSHNNNVSIKCSRSLEVVDALNRLSDLSRNRQYPNYPRRLRD